MSAIARVRSLARLDLLLIRRERLFWLLIPILLIYLVVFRFVIPGLTDILMKDHGFDLEPYHALIASALAVQFGPLIIGFVFGMVFLDARETRAIRAMLVTPLSLGAYMGYRVAGPVVLGAASFALSVLIMGVALPSVGALIALSLVASIVGAATSLFIPSFANNKVQAMATAKILGAVVGLPAAAYFIPEPWQYLAGVLPPYWVYKAYWEAFDGNPAWGIYLFIGLVSLAALLWLMVKRVEREAYR